jgi:TPP-dependent pyruvate/acetoin dehydrogenase alpha subunit
VRGYLAKRGLWGDGDEKDLRSSIEARFREAVATAERTPPPRLETLVDDVYEKVPWHLAEQRDGLLRGPRAPASH